ncbi:MAG: hypothetical protein ACKVT0_06430 [Planctomycetaceae bacterium]
MSRYRVIILLFGPLLLIAACYCATWAISASESDFRSPAEDLASPSREELDRLSPDNDEGEAGDIDRRCQLTARRLQTRLGQSYQVVSRPPYVLAGDMTADSLDSHYRETIAPTQQALDTMFFDHAPSHPIVILLLSDDVGYRKVSRHFDGLHRDCYAGYYIRNERRIVVNISTGNGTLAHELTHALAHADCEQLPEWFDEGLASLYEHSEFSEDGLQLLGATNWRVHYLLQAYRQKHIPSIETLIAHRTIRSNNEGIDYALSRYFCLYLQERQLLGPFYRKFRQSMPEDPTGMHTLMHVFHVESFAAIEAGFGDWLKQTYLTQPVKKREETLPDPR